MEITRRQFSVMILSIATLCAAGLQWFATRSAPSRFLKALRPKSFPGRLRPLDESEIGKEGKWSG